MSQNYPDSSFLKIAMSTILQYTYNCFLFALIMQEFVDTKAYLMANLSL